MRKPSNLMEENYVYLVYEKNTGKTLVFAWKRSPVKEVLCKAARVLNTRTSMLEFAGKIDPDEIGTFILIEG